MPNVGIGTTLPAFGAKLEVHGGAIAAGSIGSGAGNGGQVRFYDLGSSGNNYVAFRAPDSVDSDVTWTLPSIDGTIGQVLSTNGAGSLSWATSSSGSGPWLLSGTTVTYAGGDALLNGLTIGRGGGGVVTNTAFGVTALASNTASGNNTAFGHEALMSQTQSYSTAFGQGALRSYNAVQASVAVGSGALYAATTGDFNTAVGTWTLLNATTGQNNTAIGHRSQQNIITGSYNTTLGARTIWGAASSLTSQNTAIGGMALANLASGSNNVALGYNAGQNISTGSSNLVIGHDVYAPSTTADFQMNIGNIIFGTNVNGKGTSISTGNVGIGTTSPSTRLHVTGGAIAAGSIGSGTGNGGQVRFYDLGSSGNNYVAFRAADQITNDVLWTLPAADGATGTFLTTNGSGSLAWAAAGTVSGIGDFMRDGSVSMTGQLQAIGGSSLAPSYTFAGDSNTGIYGSSADVVKIATGGQDRVSVQSNGYVGIGSQAPTTMLSVNGSNGSQTPNAGSMFHVTGVNESSAAFTLDAFGADFYDSPYITMRKGRGTSASPVAVNNYDILGGLQYFGWNSSGFGSGGGLTFTATETWTPSANGSTATLQVIKTGTLASANLVLSGSQMTVDVPLKVHPSAATTGSGGTIRLAELTGNGSNSLGLRAPDSIASDITWTLPALDGTSGAILRTDGAGSMSWVSAGTASGIGDFMKDGSVSMTGALKLVGGSSITPALTFTGDLDTGVYSPSANTFSISAGGIEALRVNTVVAGANYISLYPAGTLTSPIIAGTGTDTNVDLTLQTKGTGGVIAKGSIRSVDPATGSALVTSGTTIDWSKGNNQGMSVACTATTFTNMQDGATYNLAVTETGITTCVFTHTGLTFYFAPGNGPRVNGQPTLYSFTRIGSNVFTSWATMAP